jgi:hypothetical protein
MGMHGSIGTTRRNRANLARVVPIALLLAAAVGFDTAEPAPRVGAALFEVPERVRLSWTEDTSTSMTIRWDGGGDAPAVEWRERGATEWAVTPGREVSEQQPTDRAPTFEVVLRGLPPGTEYEHRITHDGSVTETRSFLTAPTVGAPFRIAFVADTGIAGRFDGLAAGTARVLDEVASTAPTLVLGGGDYAYLNSDSRFADQNQAMDAWLKMMEPLVATVPLMPTYGNHEVLIEEDVEAWAEQFATPVGSPDGLSYSFDVAGVHFVSLLAYEQEVDAATLAWLTSDLAAARDAGVREIIPYFHRNIYGNGTVHPPSARLARQLAPVFEQFGVNIVLTAHDQSYERSYPLRDGAPTSASIDCYGDRDGVTYVKSSPAGKISNVSWDFSSFDPGAPSPEIAVRENGLHHFTVVDVAEASGLTVTTFGLIGDDSAPVIVDRFTYGSECTARPAVSPTAVLVDLADTESDFRLEAEGEVSYSTDAAWIELTEDGVGQIVADELTPGRHVATVTASSSDGATTMVPVVVEQPAGDPLGELLVHTEPARKETRSLTGAMLGGDVYVELRPADTAIGVRFEIDGQKYNIDRGAPFDFVGGDRRLAEAFDTTRLEPGPHRITAAVVAPDGSSRPVAADFVVDQEFAPPASTVPPSVPPAVIDAALLDGGADDTSAWSAAGSAARIVLLVGAIASALAVLVVRRRRTSAADHFASAGSLGDGPKS